MCCVLKLKKKSNEREAAVLPRAEKIVGKARERPSCAHAPAKEMASPSGPLLDDDTKKALNKRIDSTSTAMNPTVARLYVSRSADGGGREWKYTGIWGVLTLVIDRSMNPNAKFLRIYEYESLRLAGEEIKRQAAAAAANAGAPGKAAAETPRNGSYPLSLRLQIELPFDAQYEELSECFHAFEVEGSNAIVGFLFATDREHPIKPGGAAASSSSDAKRFLQGVKNYKPTADELAQAKAAQEEQQGRGRKKSIVGRMAEKVFGRRETVVSTPSNFEHKVHIGIDEQFIKENILGTEWVEIFKKVGLKKKDLLDPTKGAMIAEVMASVTIKSGPPTSNRAGTRPPLQTYETDDDPGAGAQAAAAAAAAAAEAEKPAAAPTTSSSLAAAAAPGAKKKKGGLFRAKFEYVAEKPEKQMSIGEGEEVTLLNKYSDGWARVRRQNPLDDGTNEGLVPWTFLEEVEMPSPPSEAAAPPPAVAARSHVNVADATAAGRSPGESSGKQPPPRKVPTPPVKPKPAAGDQSSPAAAGAAGPSAPLRPAGAPPNPLLAGIQGFQKEKLQPADTPADGGAQRPPNALLAGIQGFKKDSLAPAGDASEALRPVSANAAPRNPVAAIANFDKSQLKPAAARKIDDAPKDDAGAPPALEAASIAQLLQAKLAHIRHGVKDDEKSDSDGADDWDD